MQFSICSHCYLYKLYISFFYQRKQMWLPSEWSLFNVVLCGTLSSNTTYFTSFFKEVTIYRPLSGLSLWKKTKNKFLFWCVPMYVCKKTLAVEKDKRYKIRIKEYKIRIKRQGRYKFRTKGQRIKIRKKGKRM